MGCFQSVTAFTVTELTAYQDLTGLNQAQVLQAYKRFQNVDPLAFDNKKGRISFLIVAESLPELAENPFRYRICKVFCSDPEGFMDFDDFLDLVAVMSSQAPLASKLAWAFRIYDFNEDEFIGIDDLHKYFDTISGGKITEEIKSGLIEHILREADVDDDEAISFSEFERIMTLENAPDFIENFRFHL